MTEELSQHSMAAAAAGTEDTKGINGRVSNADVLPLSEPIKTEGKYVSAAAPATSDQTDQHENHNDGGQGEEMVPGHGEDESEYSAGGGNEDGGKPPASSARGSTAVSGGGNSGRKRERKKKGRGVGGGRGGAHAGNPALSVEDLFVTISTVQVSWWCVRVSGVFAWVLMFR